MNLGSNSERVNYVDRGVPVPTTTSMRQSGTHGRVLDPLSS